MPLSLPGKPDSGRQAITAREVPESAYATQRPNLPRTVPYEEVRKNLVRFRSKVDGNGYPSRAANSDQPLLGLRDKHGGGDMCGLHAPW